MHERVLEGVTLVTYEKRKQAAKEQSREGGFSLCANVHFWILNHKNVFSTQKFFVFFFFKFLSTQSDSGD